MKDHLPIIVIIILILAVAGLAFPVVLRKPPVNFIPKGTACTLEAKLCSDGSSVGRVGPSCEFAQCPNVTPTPTPNPQPVNKSFSISGMVTLGPTCGVERVPPFPGCEPKGYETTITITRSVGDIFEKTISSDKNGLFRTTLSSGLYSFKVKGGNILPRCNPTEIEVKSAPVDGVNIYCDTGIR